MDRARCRGSRTVDHATHQLIVAGLGPAGLEQTPAAVRRALTDGRTVIVRTLSHPAAAELAAAAPVISCDDLYEQADDFEDVYDAIARRVFEASDRGPVAYAVPGSPRVGEFAARRIVEEAHRRGIECEVMEAASFIDAICDLAAVDPLGDGLAVFDGHALPDPLPVLGPTIIAHINTPAVLSDVAAALGDEAGPDEEIWIVRDAGSPSVEVWRGHPDEAEPELAGDRTSIFIPAPLGGWFGAVAVMRRLRAECPWDREQTHHSILPNLVEEAHELADALARLPASAPAGAELDSGYAEVEEELGDVLLQVLFHIVMGEESGALRADRVGEVLRRKLIRRHPHVFGDADARDAEDVRRIWDEAKRAERTVADGTEGSIVDGAPARLPPLAAADALSRRAAEVGFDWRSADDVFAKFDEELVELREAMAMGDAAATEHELGDLLFTTVNVGRHLGIDASTALRRAVHRVGDRIRRMEAAAGSLADTDPATLEELWRRAKSDE